LKVEEVRVMSRKPVVVAVDGSEGSMLAAEWAAREAVRRKAPLRIVSAPALVPWMQARHPSAASTTNTPRGLAGRSLGLALERVRDVAQGLLIETDLLSGVPAVAVAASGSGADLLVVGSRGAGGFGAMVLGSVSRYAAMHTSCPVVVVHEGTAAVHREVAVGVRDPGDSRGALDFAFEEAAIRGAELLVVHAWSRLPLRFQAHVAPVFDPKQITEAAQEETRAMLASWGDKYPTVKVTADVVNVHPARVLASLSARADLVVLGKHAADGVGVGSIQNAVLSHAHGPVAIVPSTA
jgi:nucleotide-binding universal stress UspA family protein